MFRSRARSVVTGFGADLGRDGSVGVLLAVSLGWFLTLGVRVVYPVLLQFPGGALADTVGERLVLAGSVVLTLGAVTAIFLSIPFLLVISYGLALFSVTFVPSFANSAMHSIRTNATNAQYVRRGEGCNPVWTCFTYPFQSGRLAASTNVENPPNVELVTKPGVRGRSLRLVAVVPTTDTDHEVVRPPGQADPAPTARRTGEG